MLGLFFSAYVFKIVSDFWNEGPVLPLCNQSTNYGASSESLVVRAKNACLKSGVKAALLLELQKTRL